MEEKKAITLYVPNNIRTNREFTGGFGLKELVITVAVTGISLIVAFFVYALTRQVYHAVLVVLIAAATAFMAVRKNEINQSVVSMLIVFFRYSSKQQHYSYRYTDPFQVDAGTDE